MHSVPKTVSEARASSEADNWQKAMQEERQAMEDNDVWNLVQLPANRQALKTRWIFAIKESQSRLTKRYKARLVTKGFMQRQGVDFEETYAPVASLVTFRFLLAIGVQWQMKPHQMDVKAAFLYGELEEEVYMEQPEGFVDPVR